MRRPGVRNYPSSRFAPSFHVCNLIGSRICRFPIQHHAIDVRGRAQVHLQPLRIAECTGPARVVLPSTARVGSQVSSVEDAVAGFVERPGWRWKGRNLVLWVCALGWKSALCCQLQPVAE